MWLLIFSWNSLIFLEIRYQIFPFLSNFLLVRTSCFCISQIIWFKTNVRWVSKKFVLLKSESFLDTSWIYRILRYCHAWCIIFYCSRSQNVQLHLILHCPLSSFVVIHQVFFNILRHAYYKFNTTRCIFYLLKQMAIIAGDPNDDICAGCKKNSAPKRCTLKLCATCCHRGCAFHQSLNPNGKGHLFNI